jgi:hypothetical protein
MDKDKFQDLDKVDAKEKKEVPEALQQFMGYFQKND